MDYIPLTQDDEREMLAAVGAESIDALFADIPESLRIERLNLPAGMSEMEARRHMRALASKSADIDEYPCFLGAGSYDHFIPAAVRALASRGEFATAYTPYQPEVSQGTLQAIYEYQSMMCELTGMEVSNASLYDGASALAEAALVALNAGRGREETIAARAVHPEYRAVVQTYARGRGTPVLEAPYDPETGLIDLSRLEELLSSKTASVLVSYPNFFGGIEPLKEIAELTHRAGALLAVAANPTALSVLEPPGRFGADMTVGEGQPLGNALSFGGPGFGFFTSTRKLMRRLPGRLVGETKDVSGRRGSILTLRAREQDIRREKATSNICTNQSLNALAACVYLASLGKEGFAEVGRLNVQNARTAYGRLTALGGFSARFSAPFFNEFALQTPSADVAGLNRRLLRRGFIGGLDLGRFYPELEGAWLIAATEQRTAEETAAFAEAVQEALGEVDEEEGDG